MIQYKKLESDRSEETKSRPKVIINVKKKVSAVTLNDYALYNSQHSRKLNKRGKSKNMCD